MPRVEQNLPRMDRRSFLRLAGRAAILGGTVSMLHVQTAWAEQAVDCPIFTFHQTGGVAVDRVIRANFGRYPVTIAELGAIIRGDAPVPDKPLFCLTFDDGYRIQYEQAAPVIDRYEATATFFVMGTGWEGDEVHTYMSPEQIQDLSERGFEIGSHTINHDKNNVALRAKNRGAYLAEVFQSQTQLQDLLDLEVESFCYPYGVEDAEMVADVQKAYKQATSTIIGRNQTAGALYLLRRTGVN